MPEHEKDYDLALRVGELTGTFKELSKQLSITNSNLTLLTQKVDAQSYSFNSFKSKIAGIALGITFVMNIGWDFVKNLLDKHQ